jgi:hypothetical protein
MYNLQDILNEFSNTKLGKVRADKLATYKKIRPVYEYNRKGKIIPVHRSAKDLRDIGIRIENKRESIITEDGRIFSLREVIPNFEQWYRERKQQISFKVIQFTVDGQFVKKWDSLAQVEKEIGVGRGNLRRYFRQGPKNKFGKLRTLGGYTWKVDTDI